MFWRMESDESRLLGWISPSRSASSRQGPNATRLSVGSNIRLVSNTGEKNATTMVAYNAGRASVRIARADRNRKRV